MTRKTRTEQSSGYTILLTDDNLDYLQVTRRLLKRGAHGPHGEQRPPRRSPSCDRARSICCSSTTTCPG